MINLFRKATLSHYSWQRVNNYSFEKPCTLKGIGTVHPLSEWSICCYTMAEEEKRREGGRARVAQEQKDRQLAAMLSLLFQPSYQSMFCGIVSGPVGYMEMLAEHSETLVKVLEVSLHVLLVSLVQNVLFSFLLLFLKTHRDAVSDDHKKSVLKMHIKMQG